MAKYKVGDKVKVREDLEKYKSYYMDNRNEQNNCTHIMLELSGKAVTIKSIGCQYKIEEDGGYYYWTDEMFEGLAEKEKKEPQNEVHSINDSARMQIFVEKIIYSNPATILFYKVPKFDSYGRIIEYSKMKKSVAKCVEGDTFDKEKGLQVATLRAFKKELESQLKKF